MKILSKIALESLLHNGRFIIPNVGLLNKFRRASYIDGEQVYPPAEELDFVESENIPISEMQKDVEKMGAEVEWDNLHKELEEFRHALSQKEAVQLYGIGTFSVNEEGHIQFEALDEMSYSIYNDLPVVPLPEMLEKPDEGASTKARKRRWILWLLLLLAFIAIGLSLLYIFRPVWLQNQISNYIPTDSFENRVNISPSELTADSLALDTNSLDSMLIDSIDSSLEPEQKKKNDDVKRELNAYSAKEGKPNPVRASSCAVIVGSFSRTENVALMKKKLKTEGYDVYIQDLGNYTRIGIESSCDVNEMYRILELCKWKFNSESWILN